MRRSGPARESDPRCSGLWRWRVGQYLGTGAGDIGIGRLGARHRGEAALLDDIATIPRTRLGEFGNLHCRVALGAEAVGTDQRQRGDFGVARSGGGVLHCRAVGYPAAPAEANDGERDGAECGAPK